MYVDNFENILGDDLEESRLLGYAQSHNIEALLLYGLHIVHANHDLTNPTTNTILSDFIYKAKTSYGILAVGATAENGEFFTNVVDVYNNSRNESLEKFDIYNLEFEFWDNLSTGSGGYYCNTYLSPNGLPCSEEGAFQFYLSTLRTMETLASDTSHPITTEAYVGWPGESQSDSISLYVDRVRISAYVSNPNSAFNYSEDRLIAFANSSADLNISMIFSSEPEFMQQWLENNSMIAAENIFRENWLNGSSGWLNNINLQGFTYFTYSDLTDVPLELSSTSLNEKPRDFKIDPLITHQEVFIERSENIDALIIYDVNGQKVKQINPSIPSQHVRLDIENLFAGFYVLLIRTKAGYESHAFIKH